MNTSLHLGLGTHWPDTQQQHLFLPATGRLEWFERFALVSCQGPECNAHLHWHETRDCIMVGVWPQQGLLQ